MYLCGAEFAQARDVTCPPRHFPEQLLLGAPTRCHSQDVPAGLRRVCCAAVSLDPVPALRGRAAGRAGACWCALTSHLPETRAATPHRLKAPSLISAKESTTFCVLVDSAAMLFVVWGGHWSAAQTRGSCTCVRLQRVSVGAGKCDVWRRERAGCYVVERNLPCGHALRGRLAGPPEVALQRGEGGVGSPKPSLASRPLPRRLPHAPRAGPRAGQPAV